MSKKPRKDCLGCECAERTFYQLGYSVKSVSFYDVGITKLVPLEPCPKPLIGRDWLKARQTLQKYQTEQWL